MEGQHNYDNHEHGSVTTDNKQIPFKCQTIFRIVLFLSSQRKIYCQTNQDA